MNYCRFPRIYVHKWLNLHKRTQAKILPVARRVPVHGGKSRRVSSRRRFEGASCRQCRWMRQYPCNSYRKCTRFHKGRVRDTYQAPTKCTRTSLYEKVVFQPSAMLVIPDLDGISLSGFTYSSYALKIID